MSSGGNRYTRSGTDNWTVTIDNTPIPEPSAAALILGLAALLALHRRKA